MTGALIDLSLADLAVIYGLVLLAAGLARLRRIGQERALLVSSLRMVVQLSLLGYLLHFIFALQQAAPVVLVLLVMVGFAVQEVGSRIKVKMPRFYPVVGSSLLFGCGSVTFFFCTVLLELSPWYDPRYLVPLTGMVIGNSMTGASLAAERLAAGMKERRDEIEAALSLGASAPLAARDVVRSAYRAALIPSINAMAAMGIVFIPGMMTGQILAGVTPAAAVKYQIAIMCVITGGVALTSLLLLYLGSRAYFTPAQQLRFWPDER